MAAKDKKKRKADELTGGGGLVDRLKERRERVEGGDLTPQKPVKESGKDPVSQANERAQARIERLRKKYGKK